MKTKLVAEDYLALLKKFQALNNGEKASIRREIEPDDLKTNPVFYRLIEGSIFTEALPQVARLIYFLPFLPLEPNKQGAKKIGAILNAHEISERRLFLVMRSESPADLIQLRRLLQQIKHGYLDYPAFANMLFYWGKLSKQELMEEFYLSAPNRTQQPSQAVDADH